MNKDNDFLHSQLPYAALDDVPNPKSDAKEIVGLVKSSGKISGYQLSDGSEGNNLGNLPAISESELSSNAKG